MGLVDRAMTRSINKETCESVEEEDEEEEDEEGEEDEDEEVVERVGRLFSHSICGNGEASSVCWG
jgi:hypothetical protein